jgi:hypothetical protein
MKTAPHTMHLLLSGAVVVLLTGCNAGDPVSTGGVGDGGTSTGDTGTLAVLAGIPSGVGSADGTGAAARFNTPNGVAADGAGNLFVADFDNHTIRKITPAGVVTTFAGTAGLSGSADGTGAAARFFYPSCDSRHSRHLRVHLQHARNREGFRIGDGCLGAKVRSPCAMPATACRRAYDHRMRDLTCEERDPGLFRHLGVPLEPIRTKRGIPTAPSAIGLVCF